MREWVAWREEETQSLREWAAELQRRGERVSRREVSLIAREEALKRREAAVRAQEAALQAGAARRKHVARTNQAAAQWEARERMQSIENELQQLKGIVSSLQHGAAASNGTPRPSGVVTKEEGVARTPTPHRSLSECNGEQEI
ncbi:hypothetical protein DQ04_12981000 [Trypanosoma grayi]|uniref:hypothetical protein n=1 Tax=Trypanosoma grayi TaxID=71804 RepID=UPI0004F49A29|nr:hypothetical protein DQ04_12981000 [Trypanosoma grayi]KEG06634.1 hypothetical protein DQ04_12981000 [Trypanosoma grayi]